MFFQESPKSCARLDLEKISRKNLLTPRTRNSQELYKKTVQLKKEKRYLKRRALIKSNNKMYQK